MTASKLNTNEEKKKESVINIETCDDKVVEKKEDTETKPASYSKYCAIILLGSIIFIYIGIIRIGEQHSSVADIYQVAQNEVTTEAQNEVTTEAQNEVTTEFPSRDINLRQNELSDPSENSSIEILTRQEFLENCEQQYRWFCNKRVNYDSEEYFDSYEWFSVVIPACEKHFEAIVKAGVADE